MSAPTLDLDSEAVCNFDFSSPRTLAAMKVTGIKQSDLLLSPSATQEKESPVSEGLRRRQEVMETKRRQLIRELERTLEALDESDIHAILTPPAVDSTSLDSKLKKQREQVDKMRSRLRVELEKSVQRITEETQAHGAAKNQRDLAEKRQQEFNKEQEDELKAQRAKREAQMSKVQERLQQQAKEHRAKMKELSGKLDTSRERATQVVNDRQSGESEKSRELSGRFARIAERRIAHEQALEDEAIRRHTETTRREREVQERLAAKSQLMQDKVEERRGKVSGRGEKVQEAFLAQEKEREKTFKDSLEKMESARLQSQERINEITEKARAQREKEFNKFKTNRQTLVKEWRQKQSALRSEVESSHTKSVEIRSKFFEDTVYAKAANRGIFRDVVELNKAKLQRSEESSREQTIAKLQRNMARDEMLEEQRKQIIKSRTAVIKGSMADRMHLEHLKNVSKDTKEASVRRVNDMLRALDMPELPKSTSKEGDEGQQQ